MLFGHLSCYIGRNAKKSQQIKDVEQQPSFTPARQETFHGSELYLLEQFMARRNFQPNQWLVGSGLTASAIRDPDTLVTVDQVDVMYRNVYRLCPEPDVGLALGRAMNLTRWGVFALAMLCADSLGDALMTANRYRELTHSRFDLTPVLDGELLRIGLERNDNFPLPVDEKYAIEIFLGTLQSQIIDLLSDSFDFAEIKLQYPAPAYHRRYRDYFSCPIQFDSDRTELAIAMEAMIRPLRLTNPATRGLAEQLCEREYERQQRLRRSDFGWLIREELAKYKGPPPRLDEIANKLAVSPRTLRRRLEEAGTSFSEILQRHQLKRALQALASGDQSLPSIASACGYQDTAGFGEAFKRWTGMTPREYRSQFQRKSMDSVGSCP